MTEPGWPPAPIRTERLVLRASEARDRAGFVELFASPEVGTYIGGPQPRDELERTLAEVPGRRFGLFVVEREGSFIGMITLDRRELGYLFLSTAWGHGYATEACAAVLTWFAAARPGEPLTLVTQTANTPSMRLAAKLGFTEVKRFEAYGAEQWSGRWSGPTP
ncbi:GNAT family N-acetyltransferase [Amycolatopsis sp., V23-08]|uniref:GNAT family N-acetyltransferase n=1 Tax=Amycolatopsis heterodermiae TaxID=3110235 RepID=A0ABU5RLV3_9PSEU|nr:GNAT family N-acetyltransferase [Amycolatopsis sp., V23-08]MEA5367276.1 GNAT family N-acetyltransferase [Amycolatopsis sp., V23-08]